MAYKYGFVDKNPYLTYTDEPNKTDADVFGVYSDNPEAAESEGGGGAELGELYPLYYWFEDVPSVGDAWSSEALTKLLATSIGVGSSPLFNTSFFKNETEAELPNIAEGATVKTLWFTADELVAFDSAYTVTVITDRTEKVGAVVNLNVTATTETESEEGVTVTRFVFTVPPKPVAADITLADGESIYGVYNIVRLVPESKG